MMEFNGAVMLYSFSCNVTVHVLIALIDLQCSPFPVSTSDNYSGQHYIVYSFFTCRTFPDIVQVALSKHLQ